MRAWTAQTIKTPWTNDFSDPGMNGEIVRPISFWLVVALSLDDVGLAAKAGRRQLPWSSVGSRTGRRDDIETSCCCPLDALCHRHPSCRGTERRSKLRGSGTRSSSNVLPCLVLSTPDAETDGKLRLMTRPVGSLNRPLPGSAQRATAIADDSRRLFQVLRIGDVHHSRAGTVVPHCRTAIAIRFRTV